MRMYVNEHWVGNDIVTPRGQVFAFRPDYESSQQGKLKFKTTERCYSNITNQHWCDTWFNHCYTVRWSHKAEKFFNELTKDKRRAWEFLEGKFLQRDWELVNREWVHDLEFHKSMLAAIDYHLCYVD